jgi:hypothetical protein
MPVATPTTGDINASQGFKKVANRPLRYANWVGTAPKQSPNPYTGLPVRKKGKVNTISLT